MRRNKALIVMTFAGVLLGGLLSFALADYREDFAKTVPLKAGERFSLDNVNGGVAVSTWKESKAEIKAVKVARDDEKDLKDVEIRVEESAGRVGMVNASTVLNVTINGTGDISYFGSPQVNRQINGAGTVRPARR